MGSDVIFCERCRKVMLVKDATLRRVDWRLAHEGDDVFTRRNLLLCHWCTAAVDAGAFPFRDSALEVGGAE